MDCKKLRTKRHHIDWHSKTPGIATALLVIVVAVGAPQVWRDGAGVHTISNLFLVMSGIGIIAIGTQVVLLTGGIDFTAGTGTALAGATGGLMYIMTGSFTMMIAVAILTGLVIGFVNGLIITRLNILPFVATLAMMSVCHGLSHMVLEGRFVMLDTALSRIIGSGRFNDVFGLAFDPGNPATWPLQILSVPLTLFAVVAVFSYILLNKTRTGAYIYAIGGKEEAAKLAGVNVKKVKLKVYIFAGFCYGLASVLILSRIAQVTPNIAGTLHLEAIAAVVVGGTSIAGGKGTVGGTVLGLIFIQLLSSAMIFFRLPHTLPQAVVGIAILAILLLEGFFAKRKKPAI